MMITNHRKHFDGIFCRTVIMAEEVLLSMAMCYAMCFRPISPKLKYILTDCQPKSHIYLHLLGYFLGPFTTFPCKYWFFSNFSFDASLVLRYRTL